MKRLKQVVMGLVWCVVSVGCVAEEQISVAPMDNINAESNQSPASDFDIQIREDEYFFTKKAKDMVFDCNSGGLCAIIFDDIAVNLGPTLVHSLRKNRGWGILYWPPGFDRDKYKEYLDKEIQVYCKKTADIRIYPSYKENSHVMKGCSLYGKTYYIKFID